VFSTGKEGEGVGGRGFTANGREGTRMRKRMKKSFFTAIYDLLSLPLWLSQNLEQDAPRTDWDRMSQLR
jgi:hypothetical protein